ncbi:phage portal protein [Aliivibrio fischeri]|uniref:Phage portal protein n=1 Tax=Aliivibrio fischeri TaxID=668 RepID=A0A510UF68_ALIFS|nr:phage portal protein [Aliivibrio fischeri]GEK13233.1 phage portal protein [Aliivibrio fischeri]
MKKKKYKNKNVALNAKQEDSTVIEFGGIERVNASNPVEYGDVEFDEVDGYYSPPVSLSALSTLLTANSYHGSIVEARTRILSRDFIETDYLSFTDCMNICKDLITFGMAYIQIFKNVFGEPLRLGHVPTLSTRRGKNNQFVRLNHDDSKTWYKPNEIHQIKLYDTRQGIYGLPDYLSGIESALLSQDATSFRRKYYKNGMHMGFILYMTDPTMTPTAEDQLAEQLKKSRGAGNFSSMLINIPGGTKDGVQLIPVGNIGSKDEFDNVKRVSSQEVMVAHRFPGEIGGILPPQGASLGDPLKYSEMYYRNEVIPLQKLIISINRKLPERMHIGFEDLGKKAA